MHNELTKNDIRLMQEELDYRRITLRPQLLEAVKDARAFGDLSENFEYKAAKQDKNRNESRIRFLENMIKTAVVIEDDSNQETVGLYDKVTVYMEEDEETEYRPYLFSNSSAEDVSVVRSFLLIVGAVVLDYLPVTSVVDILCCLSLLLF